MENILKKSLCLLLCLCFVFSLAGCSSTKMTEKNVTDTVAVVEKALQTFDQKKLNRYVKSSTLNYILRLANSKDQYAQLGVSIFENLAMTVESVDLDAGTVTVKVSNKNLEQVAGDFAADLTDGRDTMELLRLLDNDEFLTDSLHKLQQNIAAVNDVKESTVTLRIAKGDKNLMLRFDDEGEDAVSGGALLAIKSIVG